MPSPLLYTWRLFYADGLAMGVLWRAGFIITLCVGQHASPLRLDQQFLATSYCPPHVTLRQCLFLLALMT
ncbi:hypothetical protein A6J63_024865 [Yersinia enterocolitica]|nr:hypothetical protein A6J63_024865 [Yersinia enterocolitica]